MLSVPKHCKDSYYLLQEYLKWERKEQETYHWLTSVKTPMIMSLINAFTNVHAEIGRVCILMSWP